MADGAASFLIPSGKYKQGGEKSFSQPPYLLYIFWLYLDKRKTRKKRNLEGLEEKNNGEYARTYEIAWFCGPKVLREENWRHVSPNWKRFTFANICCT